MLAPALVSQIEYLVDTGTNREVLVRRLTTEPLDPAHPTFSRPEVENALRELLASRHQTKGRGGWIVVTRWMPSTAASLHVKADYRRKS